MTKATDSDREVSIASFGKSYKQNAVKAYGTIDSPWSLDAPVSYDNDTKLIDTISEGLW